MQKDNNIPSLTETRDYVTSGGNVLDVLETGSIPVSAKSTPLETKTSSFEIENDESIPSLESLSNTETGIQVLSDNIFGQFQQESEPEFDEEDYGWGITSAFKRGFERLRALPDIAQGDYEELAQHFKNLDDKALSPDDQKRMEELQNTEGFWKTAGYYLKNPALISQIVAESLPMMTAPVVGGAIGAVVGNVPGATTGIATGSYATEFLSSVADFFDRQGVDLSDPEQLKNAFNDAELMSDARSFANKRGVPIAVFDTLSFGLAGRIYKPTAAVVGGAKGKALGFAGETTMQAGFGMSGEATAQLSSVGEIEDMAGVVGEGFGEIVPGFIEQGAKTLIKRAKNKNAPDDLAAQLNKELTPDELDAAIAQESGVAPAGDALSQQASKLDDVKEKIRVKKYNDDVQVSETLRQESLIAEQEIAKDAKRASDFVKAEQQRDARIAAERERQTNEAEYQNEFQKAEQAELQGKYETPETSPASEPTRTTSAPSPGVSVGAALQSAQNKFNEGKKITADTESSQFAKAEIDSQTGLSTIEPVTTGNNADVANNTAATPRESSVVQPTKSEDIVNVNRTNVEGSEQTDITGSIPQKNFQKTKTQTQVTLETSDTKLPKTEVTTPAQQKLPTKNSQTTPASPTTDVSLDQTVEIAANESATSPLNEIPQPSEAQKKAGNYKKGHTRVEGLDITIENPKGSTRLNNKLKDHYGYIKRTEGADGDQVDVFISPKTKQLDDVFVIDQTTEDGKTFDEHKVMIGYANEIDAIRGYKRNYDKGWKVGPITKMSMKDFKTWLKTDTKKAIAGEASKTASPVAPKNKQKKPSRHARKFVRNKKGIKYSLPNAKKALSDDAKKTIPNVNEAWIKKVVGDPVNSDKDGVLPAMLKKQALHETVVNDGKGLGAFTKPQAGMSYTPTKKVTKQEAQESTAPLLKSLPGINSTIHESIESMPDGELKRQIQNAKGAKPRAVYDPNTDSVHVFSDRFENTDDVVKAMLHEGVAHQGLRAIMTEQEVNDLAIDVYKNATDKKKITELKNKYKNKLLEGEDLRALVGEEYIAHMAENNIQPDLLTKVVAAVRKQLRKLKIVKKWTDKDINALLSETRKALRKGKPLDQVVLKESVVVEETGEIFDIETKADIALRQHDKRVNVITKLRACL